jgi:hypothetical protein
MLRRFLLSGVLALALAATVCWSLGMFRTAAAQNPAAETPRTGGQPPAVTQNGETKTGVGAPLFQPVSVDRPGLPLDNSLRSAVDPVIIPNARLGTIDKVDLPAMREGVLFFVGVEAKPGENVQDKDVVWREKRTIVDATTGNKKTETIVYRRLRDGEHVEKDQVIAMVDNRLANAEVASKEAKLTASDADYKAAIETRNEAEERWKTADKLFKGGQVIISREDWRGAFVTWERYKSEAVSKYQAIFVAKEDLNEARTVAEMHDVRAKIAGRVKTIYKTSGEVVKREDPVILQIQGYTRLKVEGMVEPQFADTLRQAEALEIEPTFRDGAKQTFNGHRAEINGVAVSKGPDSLIVSASEDWTARVWKRGVAREQKVLNHDAAVRAVACTPPGAKANLCLTGDANGRLRLWELDQASTTPSPLRELEGKHRGSIRCLAFSPDGKTCASGGDDREIRLWDAESGALRYTLTGHRDVVTSLSFTPDAQLVSVGRDETVRVWKLGETSGEPARSPIRRHSNEVTQLGVSPDGKAILDEQGAEMRILSLDKELTEASFQSVNKGMSFKTVALFSPDGRLVLTANGNDGQLQLWRLGKTRSNELRQLFAGERSPISCAAFDPSGKFIVGGTKDRKVYVWDMPTEKEISLRLTAKLVTVEPVIENAENKRRVVAEMDNPDEMLSAGDVVTIVAYPGKK